MMNGKLVRVKRPETIDGIDIEEYLQNNADPVFLHQNQMWEYIKVEESNHCIFKQKENSYQDDTDDDIPF